MTPAVQMMVSDSMRLAGRELDDAVDGRDDLGVEVHLGAAAGSRFSMTQRLVGCDTSGMMRPIASMRWKWVSANSSVGYLPTMLAREAAELAEDLDAGEAAADHDEGEQAVALRAGREVRGLVEVVEQTVADIDRLLDVLHADRLVGDARDRERARDRPAVTTTMSYSSAQGSPPGGRDRRGLVRVVDVGHARGDDAVRLR